MPDINGHVSETRQVVNLAAFWLSAAGRLRFRRLSGRSTCSTCARSRRLSMAIVDMHALEQTIARAQCSTTSKAAKYSYKSARELCRAGGRGRLPAHDGRPQPAPLRRAHRWRRRRRSWTQATYRLERGGSRRRHRQRAPRGRSAEHAEAARDRVAERFRKIEAQSRPADRPAGRTELHAGRCVA